MGHEWGHHEPYRAEILHARSLPHPSKISPLGGPYFIDKMRKIVKIQKKDLIKILIIFFRASPST